MAKRQSTVTSVAETVGQALGKVAASLDAVAEQHPHPIDEMRDVMVASQERIAEVSDAAKTQVQAAVKKTKAVVAQVKATAAKARTQTSKTVAAAKGKTSKAVVGAKRAATRTAKTVRRQARTVQKTVQKKPKKAVAKGRKAVRRRR
jgi:hypothetical protein